MTHDDNSLSQNRNQNNGITSSKTSHHPSWSWSIKGPENLELIETLAKELNISKVTAKVLINRKIDTIEKANNFLNGQLTQILDPMLLKDMDKAINRIFEAIQNKESICIYGDFDVDGTVSTSLLIHFFREINYPIDYYIPNRLTEGYSLNNTAIDELKNRNIKLIITVDNGIMAFEPIEYANSKNIDVIVTDHHQVAETLPNAHAIVNPQRKDCTYPFKGICGAGVAYKLLIALRKKLREENYFKDKAEPNLKQYLDLLSIATVCDIVPLKEENRVFVKEGLKVLANTYKPGVKALLEVSQCKPPLTAYDLGFKIGPRINACGRLENASLGVELLTCENYQQALSMAKRLNQLNNERRDLEKNITEEAISTALKSPPTNLSVVVFDTSWHIGVVGIVASRIVDKLHKPTFVLCETEEGLIKGSGRSVSGVNLVQALNECSEILEKFGGHEAAAGVTLKKDNLSTFQKNFEKAIRKQIQGDSIKKIISVDHNLQTSEISRTLLDELKKLEPFGCGNAKPIFVSENLEVLDKRIVGEKHLKLKLCDQTYELDAIAFNKAEESQNLNENISLLYGLEINSFRNRETIQMVVKEFINLQERPENIDY